ncbi:MAG: transcriptional regulator [bacterium]|nr:transcriptional regulator [bacterium]
MKKPILPELDPIVHAPARLAILSILISAESAGFNYLKEALDATDGNLSTHLSRLEAAGLITIEKTFEGKKPSTRCVITQKGRRAFLKHLDRLEIFVNEAKSAGLKKK